MSSAVQLVFPIMLLLTPDYLAFVISSKTKSGCRPGNAIVISRSARMDISLAPLGYCQTEILAAVILTTITGIFCSASDGRRPGLD
ncbi:hypothetical protein V8C35DRAFT_311973 [Trichoderma chlorosporum]